MVKPNFLIIGAMKAATTSVWGYLREHPDISVAYEKELHHFDHYISKDKTNHWYEHQFAPDQDSLFTGVYNPETTPVGEATPCYIFFPQAVKGMYAYNPDFKLIVILRDPVRRAISHYWWEVRVTNEKLPILEAYLAEKERLDMEMPHRNFVHFSYLARGRYVELLDYLFKYFSREQVYLAMFSDLVADSQGFMNNITDFLGAPRWDGYSWRNFLPGDYSDKMSQEQEQDIIEYLSIYFAPHNAKLASKYGIDTKGWL